MTTKNELGPGGVQINVIKEDMDITSAKQIWKGPPKIGKTSTAAALRTVAKKYKLDIRPFFMLCEPGSEGVELECTSKQCPDCSGSGKEGKKKCSVCNGVGTVRHTLTTRKEMREWFKWFAKSRTYNIAVVDTGDRFYQTISDDVCAELNIVSPYGANDNGIAWSVIFDEMRELLGMLDDKGVILIMHCYMVEKRTRGGSVQQSVFHVPGKAKTYLAGWADQVIHFDVEPDPDDNDKDMHILVAEHRANIEAGDRWGMFPPESKLGDSAEEAAEMILTHFGYLEE